MLRCSSRVVLMCRQLNISRSRSSCSLVKCINVNNFSRNFIIRVMYVSISFRCHCISTLNRLNRRFNVSLFHIRSNNQNSSFIVHSCRSFCKKYQSSRLFMTLSRNAFHLMTSETFDERTNINFFIMMRRISMINS